MLWKHPSLPASILCAGFGEDGEFEGETTGRPSLASLRKGWGPFCREQRPDGRPEVVPVRRRRSLTGIDSRAKGFLPPQKT